MPGRLHVKLGEWSLEALSRKERRFWQPAEKEFATLSQIPDRYFVEPEKWGRYVVLPDGHVLPHGPTDLEYTTASFVAKPDRRVAAKVLVHLVGKVVECIAAGDVVESARFAGALAHYVQDSSCPGHVINHYLLLRLFPASGGRAVHMHRVIDNMQVGPPGSFRPVVLGTSVEEAAFQAEGELQKIVEVALAAVAPVCKAIRSRKTGSAGRFLASAYHAAVQLVASLWHTCFTLAWGGVGKRERVRLATVRLSLRRPDDAFTLDPYPFEPQSGAAIGDDGELLELRLRTREGRIKTFGDGIAMVHGHAFFRIPPGVYRALRVRVGVLARQRQEGSATFKVILGTSAPTYENGTARVLTLGGRAARTIRLDAGKPSRKITVNIKGARGLTLLTLTRPLCTHVVWAEPTLVKRAQG